MSSFYDPAADGVAYTKFQPEFPEGVRAHLPFHGEMHLSRAIPIPQLLRAGLIVPVGENLSVGRASYRFLDDVSISRAGAVISRYGKGTIVTSASLDPAHEWQQCYVAWMESRVRYNAPPAAAEE